MVVGTYRFTVHVAAAPEQVFDLWTNLDEMAEWVGGVTKAIVARIFATGSYRGSFRGELKSFARLAERETSR